MFAAAAESSGEQVTTTSASSFSSSPSLPRFVKVIGVTGGIGSGKSTACRLLASGDLWMSSSFSSTTSLSLSSTTSSVALYLDADSMAHGLYTPNSPVVQAITKAFGNTVLNEETGEVNRPALGALIFNNPKARQELENIVWPILKETIRERIQKVARDWEEDENNNNNNNKFCIVIVEAALLLDAGWDDLLDATWIVTASRTVAMDRLVQGDRKMALEDVERRMAAQEASFAKHMESLVQQQREQQEQEQKTGRGMVTAIIQNNSPTYEDLYQGLRKAWIQALQTWGDYDNEAPQPPPPSDSNIPH